jgi:hypothetical protein
VVFALAPKVVRVRNADGACAKSEDEKCETQYMREREGGRSEAKWYRKM